MIQEFVARWESKKHIAREIFSSTHPENYKSLVTTVMRVLHDEDAWDGKTPSFNTIHEIDDGSYQGVLVYVIPCEDVSPYHYWYVMIDYGSCSGCDTLERIREDYEFSDDQDNSKIPNERQINDYMTLALHVVQRIKKMNSDEEE